MKNKVIIIIISVYLIIFAILSSILLFKKLDYNKKENRMNDLVASFVKQYYEDDLYNQIGMDFDSKVEALKEYEKNGIHISLYNLIRITNSKKLKELEELFRDPKTDKKCNLNNSEVYIYPNNPYQKEDYKLKIEMECE